MNVQRIAQVVAFAVATSVALPSFAAATTNEGGEYTYTGSPNDNRTTGQTGDQIWNIASPLSIGSFFPGQSDIVPYWQIYRGAAITATSNCRVMKGNVVFENAVKWTGTDHYIGLTGPAKLVLRNGGSLTTTTDHLRIGQKHDSDFPNTHGALFIEEPSMLSVNVGNAIAGNTRPGTIWMDGGTLAVSNGVFKTGGTASQDGYIRINGGVVSLGAGDADFFSIGSAANYGSLHISGGTVSTRRTQVAVNPYGHLGVGSSKAADIYVDGGLFDLWNERLDLGYWAASGTTGGRATLTVDGDGRVVMYLPIMGRSGSGNKATVNLNGGRLELTRGFATYSNTSNSRGVNFDGGTLALVRHPRTTGYVGTLDSAAGDVVVYPKGGSIDVPSGIPGNVSASFRAAEGYGVSEIALTDPGSGYVTAPEVTITGGVGSNATAYAVLNKDRTLEKIVVTCRGEGYMAGDSVTVTISSATGSGAAATATLASNAGGVIRKTGGGAWVQTANVTYGMDVDVREGSYILQGISVSSTAAFRMGGTGLRPSNGMTSSLGRLDVQNGIVEMRDDLKPDNGTATLTIGALTVTNGLALVTHTNCLALALTATDLTATSSAESPVVNGLIYANRDASLYRTPRPMVRQADGTLIPAETTTSPGPDSNWRPSATIKEADAPEVSAVNSIIIPLTPTVECYVKNTGLLDVKSGMIVVQRPQQDCQRMQVTGGGAFTTRAKGGMFIYADNKEVGKRSNSDANGQAVLAGNWRRLFGPFADPDSSTPMSLTVAGVKEARPELGAQAWLLGVQRFSGGLNLVNGGVFIQADSGLGASGSPVRASGYCSIASYNWNFNISHPIELLDGSALIFSPTWGNGGNTISSTLSGSGDLLTSDINRRGYAMAFTGDHSAFTGDYYIQGHARIAPSVFSTLAGIKLADGTNGVGVIEASGSFTRPVGTGKGEICWKTHKAYANFGYGLRGGFAARGGDLTVNLGGTGAKLVVGADYLPDRTIIQLQSQYPENESQGPGGTLTFVNGFELGGKTQKVNVWSGKQATFAGALSDAVGGGALAVTGNLALDGATLEVGAANLSAPMLTVNGTLTLAGTLNLAIDPTCLEGRDEITLATATGGVSGTPTMAGNVPSQWTLAVRSNSLVLKKLNGTVLIVR